jgi:2,5-diamino-6-(ribosylamino)-4(3H)-pyrimidinone 5'-phosphate reductase
MPHPKRPYVICHMLPSVDGRIVVDRWRAPPRVLGEYERTAATFAADAWMIGRVSMAPYAGKARIPARKVAPIPRTDHFAARDAKGYAIGLDPTGKLRWTSNAIDGEHFVTVLTEQVPDAYLAFLQSKGVSYVFGGKRSLNLAKVLVKLRAELGIETLLLEGGGKINGAFLEAGLIDELSVLVAPVADGASGTPSLFDAGSGKAPAPPARHLKLIAVEKRPGDVVWLRYEVKR